MYWLVFIFILIISMYLCATGVDEDKPVCNLIAYGLSLINMLMCHYFKGWDLPSCFVISMVLPAMTHIVFGMLHNR